MAWKKRRFLRVFFQRHPQLTEDEVCSAWNNTIRWIERARSVFDETVAVGVSDNGKVLEMVGVFRSDGT